MQTEPPDDIEGRELTPAERDFGRRLLGAAADDSDGESFTVGELLTAAEADAKTESEFGERVREARQLLGLTQRQLGNAVGLDASAISRLEQGSRAIRLGEAAHIAKALKTDIRQLLYGQMSDSPKLLLDLACDELENATIQLRNGTYAVDVSLDRLRSVLQNPEVRKYLSLSSVDVDNVIAMCEYVQRRLFDEDHLPYVRQITADLVNRDEPHINVRSETDGPDA